MWKLVKVWNQQIDYLRDISSRCWVSKFCISDTLIDPNIRIENLRSEITEYICEKYLELWKKNMSTKESMRLDRRITKNFVLIKSIETRMPVVPYWFISIRHHDRIRRIPKIEYEFCVDESYLIEITLEKVIQLNANFVNRIIKDVKDTKNQVEYDNSVTILYTLVQERYYKKYKNRVTASTDIEIYRASDVYLNQYVNQTSHEKYERYNLDFEKNFGEFFKENRRLLKRLSQVEKENFVTDCCRKWSRNKISTERLEHYLERVRSYIK